MSERPPKVVTGYCEPWSLRAGEAITLFSSSHSPGPADLSLVRIDCGDPTSAGPGYAETPVTSTLPAQIQLTEQPLSPGSYASVDLTGLTASRTIALDFWVRTTRLAEPQQLMWLYGSSGDLGVVLDQGRLFTSADGSITAVRETRLASNRWYRVVVTLDLDSGDGTALVTTELSRSPGRDAAEPLPVEVTFSVATGSRDLVQLVMGGSADCGGFDGRIGEPSLAIDDTDLSWDFCQDMATRRVVETSDLARHGVLHQLPTRGVTGPSWDATQQRWADAPEQWNAAHFHKLDLYDAGWDPSAQLDLPADLPSGIYAFLVRTADGDDRVPFFVRPGVGTPTNDVALLMSSATYIAYANHRMLFDGADFIAQKDNLRPEHKYVQAHPEVGRSMYEKHSDGSGVMFSSRRRPVLYTRPGADGWNFTPDTDINAFLDHTGVGHDIIGDEDVHIEGADALAPYRVIVTCSHPEYWSTPMLDALEAWQRNGGRLMYLGGNGFYWRVAFSDDWPGAIELRRAEDGVRNWQTENGENYHAFTGEYGGMWRRNGRAPNELVGIGFAAQGFAKASHYTVNQDSMSSRAAWIWDGVEPDDGRIGTSGLGGGAAGQELDRYDTRLGSPAHAVVLASATEFGPDMLRTKEEFEGSIEFPKPDPYVRADIVFYETPAGGAVFSVGSISWFGALARNGYDNDVAAMTTNVLRRFTDPAPFTSPAPPA